MQELVARNFWSDKWQEDIASYTSSLTSLQDIPRCAPTQGYRSAGHGSYYPAVEMDGWNTTPQWWMNGIPAPQWWMNEIPAPQWWMREFSG